MPCVQSRTYTALYLVQGVYNLVYVQGLYIPDILQGLYSLAYRGGPAQFCA